MRSMTSSIGGGGKPPIWFMSGMSNMTPYSVSLVLLINHYCSEPSRTKYKLAVVLWDCIKYKNLSLNQLLALLNDLDDVDLAQEFLDYLEKFFKNATIAVLKRLIGSCGSAHGLILSPGELIKNSSPFGIFLRHVMVSFELASFEQLSAFLKDMTHYIEHKDSVCPVLSAKQQEAAICREVEKFQNNISHDLTNKEILELCRGNTSKIQQSEFLLYLNYLSIKEYSLAKKHLHHYFTMMLNSGDDNKNICPFSALNLASMHSEFGHKDLAMQYLKESIHLGQLLGEESCLSHCIAWTSFLEGSPITPSVLSNDSENLPSHLEMLAHGQTIETMCKTGSDPADVLEHLCRISALASPSLHHTNSAKIFRWYGNGLLEELHPFFAVLQLCPDWQKNGHMITFSDGGRALCIALCNLGLSLSQSSGPPISAADLVNFVKSLYPASSSHYNLILLTLHRISYLSKKRAGACTRNTEALIRTISPSTYTALTSTACNSPQAITGDSYITQPEVHSHVLFNSARADIPDAPHRAIEKLLLLILHCKSNHLMGMLIRANLLLAEAQLLLRLYQPALQTTESVLVQALGSTDILVQSTGRWLYVQCKMVNTVQDRERTFSLLEKHLKLALDGFLAHSDVANVCDILYYMSRLYHEFDRRDDRNKCAKRYRNYKMTLSLQDPL